MAAGQGGAGSQLHRLKPVLAPAVCWAARPDGRTRRRQCRTRRAENTRISGAPPNWAASNCYARYVEQRFAPHVHSSFALVIIEQGAQRFRHRGGEHLAPLGSMVLINPDEVHTGSKAHDAGWLYRGYYPEMEQIDGILDELEIHHGGVPRFAAAVIHDQPLARAFVHLHRLLAEHAGSLETQTRWRETMLALFRRHARLPEAPKAGQEPLAGGPRPRTAGGAVARSAFAGGTGGGGQSVPFHFARSSVAPPACRPTPGSTGAAWSRPGHAQERPGAAGGGPELGFADQSHLGRQFKQAYGVAPGEYRSACARSS